MRSCKLWLHSRDKNIELFACVQLYHGTKGTAVLLLVPTNRRADVPTYRFHMCKRES